MAAARGRRLAGQAALAALLAPTAALAIAWRATGGRWFVVDSPSMGTAATVNTLLLDRPVGRLRVGEIITFRVPGTDRVFTHRIVTLLAGGGIKTKGDINSSVDGWTLTRTDILGRVSMRLWDVGWLIKAFPVLAIGAAVIWTLTHCLVRREARCTFRVAGMILVAAIAISVTHPFFGFTLVTLATAHGVARVTVVSTGILPIAAHAVGGTHVYLSDGHMGTAITRVSGADGHYRLHVAPRLRWWWVALAVIACTSPTLYALAVGFPAAEQKPGPTPVVA